VTLNVTPHGGQTVTVSGQVSDADPGDCPVSFSGVISGSVATNPDGSFSYTTTASGSGAIDATASDIWGLTGTAAGSVTMSTGGVQGMGGGSLLGGGNLGSGNSSSQPPSLTLGVVSKGGRTVTVSGQVSDANPGACMVSLSGVVSGSVPTNPDGTFSFTTTASGLGEIDGTVTDLAGLTGQAETQLSAAAPSLTLSLTMDQRRDVTLQGQVAGPLPAGDTVEFSGEVSGSVTPAANGSYSLMTEAQALGDVTAVVVDPWGQVSAPVKVTVTDKAPIIENFEASFEGNGIYLFTGDVISQSAGGLNVYLNGLPSINNVAVPTGNDGCFSVCLPVAAQQTGYVTAQVTDWWGLESDPVSFFIG
jgi:hypothetical protein